MGWVMWVAWIHPLVAVINEQDKISLLPNEVMWIEKKLFQVQK